MAKKKEVVKKALKKRNPQKIGKDPLLFSTSN
jgi:hypothetical protein